MAWIAGQPVPDMNSGLRVFRREAVLRFINVLPDSFSFTTTITLCMMTKGYNVQFEPINYSGRIGQSKIRPVRDTIRFAQLILRTGMYFAPLKVLLPVVGIMGLLSVASLTYDVFALRNMTDKSVFLVLFTLNTMIFALLADMIDKRSAS